MKKITLLLAILIVIVRQLVTFSNSPFQSTNYRELNDIWLHSQYNLEKGWEFYGNMSDEDLRSLAALEYIKGKDPSRVNFEDPPLAKYLFGISEVFLGNILIIQYLFSSGVLIITYLISERVGFSKILSIAPLLLLAFDPLFIERSQGVNLDMPQLFFILMAFFLLIREPESKREFMALGLAIGMVMASKVFFAGLLLLAFIMLVIWLRRKAHKILSLLTVIFVSFAFYLFSFSVYFFYHGIFDFFLLHIKILRMYRSYLPDYPWFEIFRIIILGKWKTWFAEPIIQPVKEYWIAWPISAFMTLMLLLRVMSNRYRLEKPIYILLGWVVVYFLFQSIHVVFPRYLLAALPFLYILSTYFFKNILKIL